MDKDFMATLLLYFTLCLVCCHHYKHQNLTQYSSHHQVGATDKYLQGTFVFGVSLTYMLVIE
jgi:hypothetical protein